MGHQRYFSNAISQTLFKLIARGNNEEKDKV